MPYTPTVRFGVDFADLGIPPPLDDSFISTDYDVEWGPRVSSIWNPKTTESYFTISDPAGEFDIEAETDPVRIQQLKRPHRVWMRVQDREAADNTPRWTGFAVLEERRTNTAVARFKLLGLEFKRLRERITIPSFNNDQRETPIPPPPRPTTDELGVGQVSSVSANYVPGSGETAGNVSVVVTGGAFPDAVLDITVYVRYRWFDNTGQGSWQTVPSQSTQLATNSGDAAFSFNLTGLTPGLAYEIRGTTNADYSGGRAAYLYSLFVEPPPPTEAEQCRLDGGTWNTTTQTCEFPPDPPTAQEQCVLDGGTWNTATQTCEFEIDEPDPVVAVSTLSTVGTLATGIVNGIVAQVNPLYTGPAPALTVPVTVQYAVLFETNWSAGPAVTADADGAFRVVLTSLDSSTVYAVRARVSADQEWTQTTFTTSGVPPASQLYSLTVINRTAVSATLVALQSTPTNSNTDTVWFRHRPVGSISWATSAGVSVPNTGQTTMALSGLLPSTNYEAEASTEQNFSSNVQAVTFRTLTPVTPPVLEGVNFSPPSALEFTLRGIVSNPIAGLRIRFRVRPIGANPSSTITRTVNVTLGAFGGSATSTFTFTGNESWFTNGHMFTYTAELIGYPPTVTGSVSLAATVAPVTPPTLANIRVRNIQWDNARVLVNVDLGTFDRDDVRVNWFYKEVGAAVFTSAGQSDVASNNIASATIAPLVGNTDYEVRADLSGHADTPLSRTFTTASPPAPAGAVAAWHTDPERNSYI